MKIKNESKFFQEKGFVNFGPLNISSSDIDELSRISREIYHRINNDVNPSINQGIDSYNNLIEHNTRAATLLNQIFTDDSIKIFLEEILGQNYKIWDICFRRSAPGDRGLYLHQDGPGQVNMAILLDDNLKGDGATAVLSGSHLVKNSQKKLRLELQPFYLNIFSFLFTPLSGRMGDIYFFSNRIWHGRFLNKSKLNHDVLMIGFFPSGYSYGKNVWSESLINLDSAPDLGSLLASSKDLNNSFVSSGTEIRESNDIYKHSEHGWSIQIEDIDYLSNKSMSFILKVSLSIIKCIGFISRPIVNILKLIKTTK